MAFLPMSVLTVLPENLFGQEVYDRARLGLSESQVDVLHSECTRYQQAAASAGQEIAQITAVIHSVLLGELAPTDDDMKGLDVAVTRMGVLLVDLIRAYTTGTYRGVSVLTAAQVQARAELLLRGASDAPAPATV